MPGKYPTFRPDLKRLRPTRAGHRSLLRTPGGTTLTPVDLVFDLDGEKLRWSQLAAGTRKRSTGSTLGEVAPTKSDRQSPNCIAVAHDHLQSLFGTRRLRPTSRTRSRLSIPDCLRESLESVPNDWLCSWPNLRRRIPRHHTWARYHPPANCSDSRRAPLVTLSADHDERPDVTTRALRTLPSS